MAQQSLSTTRPKSLIEEGLLKTNIPQRNKANNRWQRIYKLCVAIAALMLVILLLKIINDAFGLIAIADVVDPASLVTDDGRLIEEQTTEEVIALLRDSTDEAGKFYATTDRLFSVFIMEVAQVEASPSELRDLKLGDVLTSGQAYPPEWADFSFVDVRLPQDVESAQRETVARDRLSQLLAMNLETGRLQDMVFTDIVQFDLKRSWDLIESITNREAIEDLVAEQFPDARLEFYSWLNGDFLRSPNSSEALTTGIRIAIGGTIWMLVLSMVISLPLGVGEAI
jgi:phosphate transport system permease protein